MKNRRLRQLILYVSLLILVSMTLISCGKNKSGKSEESQMTENTQMIENQELYMIVENNMVEETLILYSYETKIEHHFNYGFSTQFKDKYGDFSPAMEFTPGRVVTIGDLDRDSYLIEVQLSDQVWEYEKIRRFSIDESKGILTIADTKYSIRDMVHVFSDGNEISFSDISEEEDILTVVGKDKTILSVVVTTGHGTLALRNTSLFEGSHMQLNDDMFVLISESMEFDLPEGVYTLKVANNGWGGTTEIEIVRGQTTEVDLDTLKGEGKKTGIVHFEIDAEGVKVYIDGEEVDHTQPVVVTYGTHLLQIEAPGYESWRKHLFVNSEEATIIIELTEEELEEETEEKESEKESEKEETTESEEETEEDEITTETENQ